MPKFNVGDMVTKVEGSHGGTRVGYIYTVSRVFDTYFQIENDLDPCIAYSYDFFKLINTEEAIELKQKELESIRKDLEKLQKKLQEENSFKIGDKFKRELTGEVFMLATVGYCFETDYSLVALISLKDGNRWIDAVECKVSDFKITKQDFRKVTDAAPFVKISN